MITMTCIHIHVYVNVCLSVCNLPNLYVSFYCNRFAAPWSSSNWKHMKFVRFPLHCSPQFVSCVLYSFFLKHTACKNSAAANASNKNNNKSKSNKAAFLSRGVSYPSLSLSVFRLRSLSRLARLCGGAWARERKQRAVSVSVGSAVVCRSWRNVNVLSTYVCVCARVCVCVLVFASMAYNNNIKGKIVAYCRAVCGD